MQMKELSPLKKEEISSGFTCNHESIGLLFKFSSPVPLGQFQLNLARSMLLSRQITFVQMKS